MTDLLMNKLGAELAKGRDRFEATILMERVAAQELFHGLPGQWPLGVGEKRALKVTVKPSNGDLMATAEWNWHEVVFVMPLGPTWASGRETTLDLWVLTPPADSWSEEELARTLVVMIERLAAVLVKAPAKCGVCGGDLMYDGLPAWYCETCASVYDDGMTRILDRKE